VVGRLVHDDADATPLHHARVELFLAMGEREEHIGRGVADGRGRFALPFQVPPNRRGATLRLRVLMLRPSLWAGEPPAERWRVAARAMSTPLVEPGTVDLGAVRVPWWERRAGGRLAPLPADLVDGDGFALIDRPPTPALVSGPAPRRDVSLPELLGALLLPGWSGDEQGWTLTLRGAMGLSGEPELVCVVGRGASIVAQTGDGAPVDDGVVAAAALRVAAAVGARRCLWFGEQRAIGAFRALRASALAERLLPRLRGVAWAAARVEHAVWTGAAGLSTERAAHAMAVEGPVGGRPGGPWPRIEGAARAAMGDLVAAWRGEGLLDDPEVAYLRAAWGAPAPNRIADPASAAIDPLDLALEETLVRLLVEAAWTRAWLASAASAGWSWGLPAALPWSDHHFPADPAGDLTPDVRRALERVAAVWGDAPGGGWASVMP
jgi:hypothetical protein